MGLGGFDITKNDAPQSVGLLWTSDQLVAETSTSQNPTLTTRRQPCPLRESNPQSQQASGCRPTPLAARPPESALTWVTRHQHHILAINTVNYLTVSLAFRKNDYIDECATNTGSCLFTYLAFRKNNYESTSYKCNHLPDYMSITGIEYLQFSLIATSTLFRLMQMQRWTQWSCWNRHTHYWRMSTA